MPAFALAALKHWKLVGLGLLCLLLAVQTVRLGHAENVADNLRIRLKEVVAERDQLIAAAKEAERLNKEQVQRIVTEQDRISNDIESKYEADLARLRAELGKRLRPQANNGSPKGPGASPDVQGSPGADEETRVCIPTSQYVRGAETELQLDTIIDLLEKQQGVVR